MDDSRTPGNGMIGRKGWWDNPKGITAEQIGEALSLIGQKVPIREVSRRMGIPLTTLWENTCTTGRKPKYETVPTFRNTPSFRIEVQRCKAMGLNTMETSLELEIPLKDVNYLWIRVSDSQF